MTMLRTVTVCSVFLLVCAMPLAAQVAGKEEKLIEAVKWGDLAKVEQEVDSGADVNAQDPEQLTPLICASAAGHKEIVEKLLHCGANANGRGALGFTPLCVAAYKARVEGAKLLLAHNADVNAKTEHGWAPLLFAAISGSTQMVSLLFDSGADVNATTVRGSTALNVAANLGRTGVVELLLKSGARVDAGDEHGTTPLIAAAYRGNTDVVKLLLDAGADVNARDRMGKTALMCASLIGHTEIVKLLMGKGADAQVRSKEGTTALVMAEKRGHREIVRMLSQKGMDTLVSRSHGSTAAQRPGPKPPEKASGERPPARETRPTQDVVVTGRATKIAQLVGEYDRERHRLTENETLSRYKLMGTDLGVPFRHKGRTYLVFGDTSGLRGGDAIAYTVDTTPEDGLDLTFVHDDQGVYKPVTIPGISQGSFEVPMEGVSVGGRMYVYHTTDHSRKAMMGRSVVAVSDDDGSTFSYLYDLSTKHFINVSIVQVDTSRWKGLPASDGTGHVIFGTGTFRKSDVRLAFQPAAEIESPGSIRYFAGVDASGEPTWSEHEHDAQALFHQPCIGELSVSYNRFIEKWIMLYNCEGGGLAIYMRTADRPWGPWSVPQSVLDGKKDGAYCHFLHSDWKSRKCDILQDSGREQQSGGLYGPYQFEDLAVGDARGTTIYFTVSTWNPYTVVLMKASLKKRPPHEDGH